MFFRRNRPKPDVDGDLRAAVCAALPNADTESQEIVHAILGLLGCISYADRQLEQAEEDKIREILSEVEALSPSDADQLVRHLRQQILHVSTVESPRYSRTLKSLAAPELRLHILGLLLDVAAADGEISHQEVVVMRQITTSLGLDQSDYNELQQRHRLLLASLK